MKTLGIAFFPDDDYLLLELIIVDDNRRGNWYSVSESDVYQACTMFDLPYEKVMDIVDNKDPAVHTLLINAPVFLKETCICPGAPYHREGCPLRKE